MRPRNQLRAFTLIELLVVIANIAIFASILLPAFSAAKARAQITKCISNFSQIGVGLTMYANDNNETMPPSNNDQQAGRSTSGSTVWFVVCMGGKDPGPHWTSGFAVSNNRPFQRYVPAAETFHCPADRGQGPPP